MPQTSEVYVGPCQTSMMVRCLLKGHTYLNRQLKAAELFKYMWPLGGHQALKG